MKCALTYNLLFSCDSWNLFSHEWSVTSCLCIPMVPSYSEEAKKKKKDKKQIFNHYICMQPTPQNSLQKKTWDFWSNKCFLKVYQKVLPSLTLISKLFCFMFVLCFIFYSVNKTTRKSVKNIQRWWSKRNALSALFLEWQLSKHELVDFSREMVRTMLTSSELDSTSVCSQNSVSTSKCLSEPSFLQSSKLRHYLICLQWLLTESVLKLLCSEVLIYKAPPLSSTTASWTDSTISPIWQHLWQMDAYLCMCIFVFPALNLEATLWIILTVDEKNQTSIFLFNSIVPWQSKNTSENTSHQEHL